MAKKKHGFLELVGLGAAAFAGYKFVYEPWRLNQDALAASAAGGTVTPTYTSTGSPSILSTISSPTPAIGTSYPITPSNLDPGAAVGGAVGACMHKKGLTQGDCTDRLQKLTTAIANDTAQLQALQSGAAASALKTQLAANQAALTSDMQNLNTAKASGNQAGVVAYTAAMKEHQANVNALNSQLASIAGQITAYQAALASQRQNYTNYTGLTLA